MSRFSLFLVIIALATLAIVHDAEGKKKKKMSRASRNILKKVLADIKEELTSDDCMTSATFVVKKARSDEIVAHRCGFAKTFGKAMMRSTCKDLDMKKMEAAMCGTEWPFTLDVNPILSEKTVTVLQNILSAVTSLGDSCVAFFKKVSKQAQSDDEVFNFCDLASRPRGRKRGERHCSTSEYDILKKSTCEAIQQSHREEQMYSLSTEATGILDTIKQGMKKALPGQCQRMTNVVKAVAHSDVEIYGLCHLMESEVGKATITAKCSEKEYETLTGVICDELEEKKKIFGHMTFNSNLSDEGASKLQDIMDGVYGMAEGCTTFLTRLVLRIKDDSKVDGLCERMSGPAKPKMAESCSQQIYHMLQESACHND